MVNIVPTIMNITGSNTEMIAEKDLLVEVNLI